jgi:hypothetical protein
MRDKMYRQNLSKKTENKSDRKYLSRSFQSQSQFSDLTVEMTIGVLITIYKKSSLF